MVQGSIIFARLFPDSTIDTTIVSFVSRESPRVASPAAVMTEFSVEWDSDGFAAFLTSEGFHEDIISNVIENRISSALFIELSDDDLKELAPTIGDRMVLRKVLERAKKVCFRHFAVVSTLILLLLTESTSGINAFVDHTPSVPEWYSHLSTVKFCHGVFLCI